MLRGMFNKQNRKKLIWGAILAGNLLNIVHAVNYLTPENNGQTIDNQMASMQSFAEDGNLGKVSDLSYDADANDALTRIVENAIENVSGEMIRYISESMGESHDWNRNDRVEYEKTLFRKVEAELNNHAVLGSDDYRTEAQHEGVTRHSSINNLSTDVENNT